MTAPTIERRRTKRFPVELLGLLHRIRQGEKPELWDGRALTEGERHALLNRPDLWA